MTTNKSRVFKRDIKLSSELQNNPAGGQPAEKLPAATSATTFHLITRTVPTSTCCDHGW